MQILSAENCCHLFNYLTFSIKNRSIFVFVQLNKIDALKVVGGHKRHAFFEFTKLYG